MNARHPRWLRWRWVLVALAAPGAMFAGSAVEASAPPPVTPGFVQLVDDTGTITVQVPDTWTDIDTAPSPNADGTTHPSIAASPDLGLARTTFDVPGVVYSAMPFTADPQSIIDQSGLTAGCASIAVVPYDILGYTGVAQEGSACGSAGTADWLMIVASPADQSFTAVVQIQTATAEDQGALFTVMSTFGAVGGVAPSTPPPGTAPVPTAIPGSAAPVVADPAQLVTNAATGYRTFIAGFEGVVYEDEDSIKVGDCPVVDVTAFNSLMAGLGLPGPYEAESGGEMELFADPVVGTPLEPAGVYCDLDVSDDAVTTVQSASVSVIDAAMHTEALPLLQPVIDAGGTPTHTTAGFTGEGYTLCGAPFWDETECAVVWFGSELVVALSIEYAGAPDPGATSAAFEAVLPAVLQRLASFAA